MKSFFQTLTNIVLFHAVWLLGVAVVWQICDSVDHYKHKWKKQKQEQIQAARLADRQARWAKMDAEKEARKKADAEFWERMRAQPRLTEEPAE